VGAQGRRLGDLDVGRQALHLLGKPKVDDLGLRRLGQQHVVGLEIAMHESRAVSRCESFGGLQHDFEDF